MVYRYTTAMGIHAIDPAPCPAPRTTVRPRRSARLTLVALQAQAVVERVLGGGAVGERQQRGAAAGREVALVHVALRGAARHGTESGYRGTAEWLPRHGSV